MKIYDQLGQALKLDPTLLIGDGGEAYVYKINGKAAKIYRRPDDPLYSGNEDSQKFLRSGAKRRLQVIQEKLPAFPRGLCDRVITPAELLYCDPQRQEIGGYIMPLISGAMKMKDLGKTNRPLAVDNNVVLQVFSDLFESVSNLHRGGVVIGDFNALNILVTPANQIAYLIDADSMQFGRWFCEAFTTDYVDPTICDSNAMVLKQVKPHSVQTDWYAWGTMLFESLTFLHPYLGAYEPKDARKRVPREQRPLRRITWFNQAHPGTKIPKFAVPLSCFNDDWAQYWDDLFHKDKRDTFPVRLLTTTKWVKCVKCGAQHCRRNCPNCQQAAPIPASALKETVRGNVRVSKVFATAGSLLSAAIQEGKLRYLYHVNEEFIREDGKVVTKGNPEAEMRFSVCDKKTLIGARNTMLVFNGEPDAQPLKLTVDAFRNGRPSFTTNAQHLYWSAQGMLFRDDDLGNRVLGQVLENQTRFWVGNHFGVGFYQAGGLQKTFIFDVSNPGINDRVELPQIRGQILDMQCTFSRSRAWILVSSQEQGRAVNRCFVLSRAGEVIASAQAEAGDDSWLGSIVGRCAADLPSKGGTAFSLFAAKDTGLVRAQIEGNEIVEKAAFPDTEGFVDSSHELLLGSDGIYAVSRSDIRLLQLRQ